MNSQLRAEMVAKPWLRYWPWLVVAIVLSFVAYIRLRVLEIPLERDEGEYAYAGQLILQGIPPYELAYNMKLPGTYYAYAAGMAVFGQSITGIHLTLLVVNSLTSIFTFLLGRKLFGVTAGLVAYATFSLMSVSEGVLGLAAHATQFVALPAVAGIWLLLGAMEHRKRIVFFSSGLLLGLAYFMKQPGICFVLFGLCLILLWAARERTLKTRTFAMELLTFGGAMLFPFAFFCLSAAVAGDFGKFWFWTFTYAGLYAGELPVAEGMHLLLKYAMTQLPVFGGFVLLAGVGLALSWLKQNTRKEALFATLFLAFSFLGTTPGGYFREHYFVLLLPAVAILSGAAVVLLQPIVFRGSRVVALLAFVIVAGWSVYRQAPFFFQVSPAWLARHFYEKNPFSESVLVGQYIREHSEPAARVAVLGSEPQIYFYANRRSATGYIYTYPLMEPQPYAISMQHEMMDEIEAAKPEFIVMVTYKLSWLVEESSDLTIWHWEKDYTGKFYDPVESVGHNPDGGLFSTTNVPEAGPAAGEYMAIYKRKAAAD